MSELLCGGYPMVVTHLPDEEGGGYVAYIPQLGDSAFNGCGETPADAIESLQSCYEWNRAAIEADGYTFPKPLDWQRFQHMLVKEEMLHSTTEPPLPIICPDEKKLAETAAAYQMFRYRVRALPGVKRVDFEKIDLVYRGTVFLKPGQGDLDGECAVYDLKGEFLDRYPGLSLDITVLEDRPSERDSG